eukprot:CAMPEP_0197906108 /NCGR_PEP_ID=MMETSP1439-20131203/61902_1 /TAXON_ID=66791 /ORGANISM="Gonyaulax spinifera, Strain CCMP409" /LENGTH=96 /DNA_ID=CAMNT_0043527437 /DNA_START=22 /DNA_END=310 /DNA_ORIENTATION=-
MQYCHVSRAELWQECLQVTEFLRELEAASVCAAVMLRDAMDRSDNIDGVELAPSRPAESYDRLGTASTRDLPVEAKAGVPGVRPRQGRCRSTSQMP